MALQQIIPYDSIPTQRPTHRISDGDATAPVLSPEPVTHNSTPHTLAARADNPVKQHQASNAPCPLLLRVVSSFISRASLHKQEFHSRELLQVCQQQCLPPPPQTCFLGAKQVQVQ